MSTVPGQAAPSAGANEPVIEIFEQVDPPVLGSCLDTVRGGSGPLGPPQSIDCSSPHGGEVARVLEVPTALDGPFPTDEVLNSDAWGSLLYGDDGCGFRLANEYLGARDQDVLMVDAAPYLPKRAAWESGARWATCVVEYSVGTLEDANAPGRMAQAMHGPDAASYRECWFGPEVLYDVVPCSQPHEAEPTRGTVTPEAGTSYPTDPLTRQPLIEECTNTVIDYLEGAIPNGYSAGIYLPPEPDWEPYPEVDCVILDSDGRRRAGSAVDA